MKSLIRKMSFAICIVLTCVLCVGCGLKADIKKVVSDDNTIDSLQVEFDNAHEMCRYYQSKYDAYSHIDTFWHYRTKANQEIDKMIIINNERMRVRNAR